VVYVEVVEEVAAPRVSVSTTIKLLRELEGLESLGPERLRD